MSCTESLLLLLALKIHVLETILHTLYAADCSENMWVQSGLPQCVQLNSVKGCNMQNIHLYTEFTYGINLHQPHFPRNAECNSQYYFLEYVKYEPTMANVDIIYFYTWNIPYLKGKCCRRRTNCLYYSILEMYSRITIKFLIIYWFCIFPPEEFSLNIFMYIYQIYRVSFFLKKSSYYFIIGKPRKAP